MKKYIYILGIFSFMFLLSSCEDFLKEEMVSEISSASYYPTEEGLEDAVKAAYSFLKDKYYAQEHGMSMTIFGTDTYANGADGGHKSLSQYIFDPTESFVKDVWISMYRAINQCNAIVERATPSDQLRESVKKVRIAEARFLRALYYFILVRHYGDVHLTLEETLGVELEANKTPRLDIYNTAIVPDLEYAMENLPVSQSDYGRATKGSAQMLLAKVQLHIGWLTGNNADFQNAISNAEAVINSGTYALIDDFASVFDIKNQEHSEVVFSVQNSLDVLINGNGNRAHLYFLMEYDKRPGMQRATEYGRPWKRFAPTPYLLSVWNREFDSRFSKTFSQVWLANNSGNLLPEQSLGDTAIFIPGVNIGEKYYMADENGERIERTLTQGYVDERHNKYFHIYTPDERNGEPFTGYSEKTFPSLAKVVDPLRPNKNHYGGSRDWMVLRLAEAYLIVAEAAFKVGDMDKAAANLNVVRKRGAWPGFENQMEISAADVSLEFILDERARELAGEMHRWFDLTRTGTLVDRVKEYCNATNSPNYAVPNITDKHILRPIPQDQIDKISGDYEQNPGW